MTKTIQLRDEMRIIEDFPKAGISYKDITPILQKKEVFQAAIHQLQEALAGVDYDYIVGIEARGFIMGAALAYAEGKGFLMCRKEGKLPGRTVSYSYDLEYGQATVEMDQDSVPAGARLVILDDLLATGGTAAACAHLIELAGGRVALALFITELTGLEGRQKLEELGISVRSLITWPF